MRNVYILILLMSLQSLCKAGTDDLTTKLTGYWCFDNFSGATVPDASNNGNTGKVNGGLIINDGISGKCLTYTGTDSWVEIPANSMLDARDFTVMLWFKMPAAIKNEGTLLTRLWNGDNKTSKYDVLTLLTNRNAGKVDIYYNYDGNESNPNNEYFTANYTIQDNAWTHVAVTKLGKNLKVFINGLPNLDITLQQDNNPFQFPGDWIIGSQIDNGAAYSKFTGSIDEVRIFGRNLSADEISAYYMLDNGTAFSASVKSFDYGKKVCEKSTTDSIVIFNKTNSDIVFTSLETISKEFSVLPSKDLIIKGNSQEKIYVTFNNINTGSIKDTLKLFTPYNCSQPAISIPLQVQADQSGFEVSGIGGNIIDLGFICPLSGKDTSFSFKNTSSFSAKFSFSDPGNPFTTDIGGFTDYLKPGESRQINVLFLPSPKGDYSNILVIKDTCGNTVNINLKVSVGIRSLVFLPDTTARLGDDNFCFELGAGFDCSNYDLNNLSFSTDIITDAYSFLPNTSNNYEIKGGKVIIHLVNLPVKEENGRLVLAKICGTILNPNEKTVPVTISDFTWSNPEYTGLMKNGSLEILGCSLDISKIRLITLGSLSVSILNNNNLNIDYTASSPGVYILHIFNIRGESIAKNIWNFDENFANTKIFLKNILIENLTSGLYIILLESPSGQDIVKTLIPE